MKSKKFYIYDDHIRSNTIAYIKLLPLKPPHKVTITEIKSIRSIEQNKKMWAMLTDISKQVIWHGYKLTPENWKDMITAAIKRQKVVPGIEGGFVALGQSTSRMSIKEMIDVIECAYAFGADPDHIVEWSEPEDDEPPRI